MARFTLVRSIFIVLGVTLSLAAISTGALVAVFGMRIEMRGSGFQPLFSFDDPEEHYTDLEENRAQHYSHLLQPPPSKRTPRVQADPTGRTSEDPNGTDDIHRAVSAPIGQPTDSHRSGTSRLAGDMPRSLWLKAGRSPSNNAAIKRS